MTPSRTYYMCAESLAAQEDWIRELVAERDRVQGKRKKTAASGDAPAATPVRPPPPPPPLRVLSLSLHPLRNCTKVQWSE